jgi:predicted RNA-binding protein YlxR (DUF448 family)
VEPKKMKYRFNWNAPIVSSPHDASVIYHAGNVLLKTTNGGMSWEAISGDLTRNDSTKQGIGGGPITNEGAGGENYNTINYVIESSLEKGVIWTGSDCGLVYVTMNGGQNWNNITPADLQESMIHSIELSPHDKGTAYICATRYKFNDYTSYTYKTTDYGKTWTKIVSGVDKDDFIRVIREDRKVKDLLYAGSERGFYISFNGGTNWNKFQLNLPVVLVTDLAIRDNDLIAATAGRAFWILDDLSAIQQSKGVMAVAKAKIFSPKAAYHYSGSNYKADYGDNYPNGANPLQGVILDYYLPEKPDTNMVTLEIADADNKVVKTFTNKADENFKPYPGGPAPATLLPAQNGLNRFAWNLRGENIAPEVPGAFLMYGYSGYLAAPGKYKARLSYKGTVTETAFEVLPEPNLKATAAHWSEQQQFLNRIGNNVTDIHTAINSMRKVKKQVEAYNDLMKDASENAALVDKGKALIKQIETWESNLIETRQKNFQDVINFPSRLNVEFINLKVLADAHDPRITKGLKDRLADLEKEWAGYKAVYENELKKGVEEYNSLFKSKNLPAIMR